MGHLAAIAALAMSGPATAADVETHLRVTTVGLVDLQWDRPGEDLGEVRTWVDGGASGPTAHGRWQLQIWGRHELLAGQAPQGDMEAAWEVVPGESGWEGRAGPGMLRAGYLVERWGNLDLLSTLDVLNGRDLRAGPLTPLERLRVPSTLLRYQLGGAQSRAELTVLPFGARDQVGVWGTDLSLVRQGMAEGLARDVQSWPGDGFSDNTLHGLASAVERSLRDLDAQTRRGAEAAFAQRGRPRALGESIDVAGRLETTMGRVDAAVVGAWMRNRQPLATASPAMVAYLRTQTLPTLADQDALLNGDSTTRASWPRTGLAGLELATVLGSLGIRSESALWTDRVVTRQWLQGATRPMLAQGLAVDRAWGTWLTVAAEGRWSHLFDAPQDTMMMGIPNTFEAALAARADVARGRLSPELGGVANLTFREVTLRPGLRWRVTDVWEVGAGASLWLAEGPAAVDWQDALTWEGGPIGYAHDTDAAWLSVSWIQ